jgi:uncharacterized membrane protein
LFGSSRFPELSPFVFALGVALVNDILCQVSYNFVALPVIGKLVKLPFWAVLSGVMLGAALNSILFAFLVIPFFSTVRLFGTYLLSKMIGREPFQDQTLSDDAWRGFFSQFLMSETI